MCKEKNFNSTDITCPCCGKQIKIEIIEDGAICTVFFDYKESPNLTAYEDVQEAGYEFG